jgi:hypothetical protein
MISRNDCRNESRSSVALTGVVLIIFLIALTPSMISEAYSVIPAAAHDPKVTLRPMNSSPGKTVKVTGTNFTPSDGVTIAFAGNEITTTSSNSTGGFVADFAVPLGIPAGLYPVGATDQNGLTAENSLNITLDAKITLSTSGSSHIVGATLAVKGSGFPPDASVDVYFGTSLESSPTTTSEGSFSSSFPIPEVPNAIYTVQAVSGTYSATNTFPLVAHLSVSPTGAVQVGSSVTVSGTGFAANSQVTITLGSTKISTEPTTGTDGAFSVILTVPNLAKGGYTLEATDQSANSAETKLSVSN